MLNINLRFAPGLLAEGIFNVWHAWVADLSVQDTRILENNGFWAWCYIVLYSGRVEPYLKSLEYLFCKRPSKKSKEICQYLT